MLQKVPRTEPGHQGPQESGYNQLSSFRFINFNCSSIVTKIKEVEALLALTEPTVAVFTDNGFEDPHHIYESMP